MAISLLKDAKDYTDNELVTLATNGVLTSNMQVEIGLRLARNIDKVGRLQADIYAINSGLDRMMERTRVGGKR